MQVTASLDISNFTSFALYPPPPACVPQVYFRQWMKNFEDWWTFGSGDHTAGACHACVVLTHYLSERQISVLRDSGVPILCQVCKGSVWYKCSGLQPQSVT
jgi:hypothetical protein